MNFSALVLVCLMVFSLHLSAVESFVPRVIDDQKLMRQMLDGFGKLADAKKGMGSEEARKAVRSAPRSVALALAPPAVAAGDATHEDLIGSVVLISSVYDCGKCDEWHLGGIATAWCLTADGVFVTNAHVFEVLKGELAGICTVDGRVAAVKEILAADRAADVCLFRVEGDGFRPLVMGTPAPVGSKVRVISHPDRRLFFQTSGEVGRYHLRPARGKQPASTWMSITADFAKGSSGGPVVDTAGRVVGMVSSTQSIYYESSGKELKGPLQMVIKNCVPVSAIQKLLEPASEAPQAEAVSSGGE